MISTAQLTTANIINAKAELVAGLKEKIQGCQSVVIVDYRGYTVAEDTELRNNFRKAGVEYTVIKNTYLERACEAAGIDASVNEFFKGPTAVAFGVEDPAAPAKVIKEFVKKTKKGVVKGGIINGVVSNAAAMDELAEIPPREVLIARILGSMNAPITKLAIALNAIKEKMEEGAPAEAAAEPAAE